MSGVASCSAIDNGPNLVEETTLDKNSFVYLLFCVPYFLSRFEFICSSSVFCGYVRFFCNCLFYVPYTGKVEVVNY